MATGYTACLAENNVSFEEFVWQCARAFGPFIHMRDDGLSSEIRMPDPRDEYYTERLQEAREELEKYTKMTLQEAHILNNKSYNDNRKRIQDALKGERELKIKYSNMLDKVKAWTPPSSDHENLKKFMIEQIETSIKHDCDESYYLKELELPQISDKKWLETQRQDARDDIDYASKHIEESNLHYKEKIAWITALQSSVSMPNKK